MTLLAGGFVAMRVARRAEEVGQSNSSPTIPITIARLWRRTYDQLLRIVVAFVSSVAVGAMVSGPARAIDNDVHVLVKDENYKLDIAMFCMNSDAMRELVRSLNSGREVMPYSCYNTFPLVFKADFKVQDVKSHFRGVEMGFVAGWMPYKGEVLRVYVAFGEPFIVKPADKKE
jgi:hypothetical protein